jgi:menaquinone-9 beta-reductase
MTEVDLLVVGAGPAGSAAAVTARHHGLDVLVVDKARFPRDKTCGDGLTAGALRRLRALGVDVTTLPSYAAVHTAVLVAPHGRQVELPLGDHGSLAAVVARRELDAALVARARELGVTVREGVALTQLARDADRVDAELADGRHVRARWLVAADGHYSTVRRLLNGDGSRTDLGTWHAFRQYFRGVDDNRLWVFFDGDLLPGYAWIFPVGDGRANVGFGVLRDAGVRARGPVTGKQLAAQWRDVIARPDVRRALGAGAEPDGPVRAWPIPARWDESRLAGPGPALFAGDAAAVVDPLTGEGIAQALETGALAADTVAGATSAAEGAARYRAAVRDALRADLRLAAALQALLRSPTGARASIAAAALSPWTRRNFARWMFEDYPRAALFTPRRWRALVPGRQRPPP